ncbi:MAG: ABC transporter ATP-binding protein [Candidatus Kariarchaeaceae archaeon]
MVVENGHQEDYDRPYTDMELIKRFYTYLIEYKLSLIFIISLIIGLALVNLVPPILVSESFDALKENKTWNDISIYVIGYVVFTTVIWILQVITNIRVTIVTQRIIKKIQLETFESLQEHDLSFFDKQATGKIMSRVTNDSQELNQMIGIVANFISNIFIIFTVLVLIFLINWRLTLVTLAIAPIVFFSAIIFRRFIRTTSKKWRESIGKVNASFQESVSGIAIAKAFGREKKSMSEFMEINENTYQIAKKRALGVTGIHPWMDAIIMLATFSITLTGSYLTFEGFADEKTLLLFLLLLTRFFGPLMRIASQISTVQSGFAAMERVFSLIDAEKTILNPLNPVEKQLDGEISLVNIYFEYVENIPVLENINLHIKPGEMVAIVGHTGAGKTTIASLLMRYYDVTQGSLKVDNVDVRDFSLASLRSQIGLVSQDVFLFSGTVLDNIRFGKPDASLEEVRAAMNIVSAEEFINALPDGLQTKLGERGQGLSAGQRQMVSFARTLITDPKILILDEATASVDAYTESKIQTALESLLKGRTSIVIAHRLTTVQNADRIIVMDQGKIVEEGNHEQLVIKKGVYNDLYETYFKHQSAEWMEDISKIYES